MVAPVGLYWFSNDLRLADNLALINASKQVDRLLCVYIDDQALSQSFLYSQTGRGEAKQQFLAQSLASLSAALIERQQRLFVLQGSSIDLLSQLIERHNISHVFRSFSSGFNENRIWQALQQTFTNLVFDQAETVTLFNQAQLPFPIADLPVTFTKFRKRIENLACAAPRKEIESLPPMVTQDMAMATDPISKSKIKSAFQGSEKQAHQHLQRYFSGELPQHYKQVRNALDGWDNSSKFSPWLAHGCLSVRQIMQSLDHYEKTVATNQSTYWIFFELLWREYFQWYARLHGKRLFQFSGLKAKPPLTSYYAERFQKWCHGNTPYPLVNACMNELSVTGYLSNRGRQIVASCLVNELQIDWRYGAAYFERILIDYDVASNWGNWQYLAGVGADVQDKRHFNLEKQTELFDPQHRYIHKWSGQAQSTALDSVDAADWPIH